ncbi:hypothetical protein [Kineosporia sp. NBRC 101731]|uniref:hypothetical protein n=1 Tax=Kineosporia sp. NBRC 101731 TaxID=3032199 RepID=UPI0024A4200A|nr:hypothetical protein [Kineosporia sp. NBRC 101731]GLY32039.1 hypothetical protein Kisp02_54040 [Kineosporia sp. NBRC 101731]
MPGDVEAGQSVRVLAEKDGPTTGWTGMVTRAPHQGVGAVHAWHPYRGHIEITDWEIVPLGPMEPPAAPVPSAIASGDEVERLTAECEAARATAASLEINWVMLRQRIVGQLATTFQESAYERVLSWMDELLERAEGESERYVHLARELEGLAANKGMPEGVVNQLKRGALGLMILASGWHEGEVGAGE